MKQEIYLHIGLYKCASTLIQKTLHRYDNNELDVFTPDNGRHIYDKFREILKDKNKRKNFNFFKSLSSKKKVIISIEGLLGHQSNGFYDINKRFKILEKIFKKPKYLIIFRNQSDLLYSAWHQGLRNDLNLNFEEYINFKKSKLRHQLIKNFTQPTNYKVYDYNKIFSNYLKIFPKRAMFINFSILEKNESLFLNEVIKFFKLENKFHKKRGIKYNQKMKQYRTNFLAKKIIPTFHKLIMKITIKISYYLCLIKRNKLWNPLSIIYLSIIDHIFKSFYKSTYENFYEKITKIKKIIDEYYKYKNKFFIKKLNYVSTKK